MTDKHDFSRVIETLEALVEAEALVAKAGIEEARIQNEYLQPGRSRETVDAFGRICVRRAALANILSGLHERLGVELAQVTSDARYAALEAAVNEGSEG